VNPHLNFLALKTPGILHLSCPTSTAFVNYGRFAEFRAGHLLAKRP
jgi:hypothetical protein